MMLSLWLVGALLQSLAGAPLDCGTGTARATLKPSRAIGSRPARMPNVLKNLVRRLKVTK